MPFSTLVQRHIARSPAGHRLEGKRFLSVKHQYEYNCKNERLRNLSVTAFNGHMGKGGVVDTADTPMPWESVPRGGVFDALRKFACG
jgi:hypothetical protein